MSRFVRNPIEFAADCAWQDGECAILKKNFLFLDHGDELAAVSELLARCGHVVIIPDGPKSERAVLYHTSCQRMTDAVDQIFRNHLEAPTEVPQADLEITIGEMYRRGVTMPYDRCRDMVADFDFTDERGP